MLRSASNSKKVHGLIFDGAIFIGNIALYGFLPRIGDDVSDTLAGTLLLCAVLTQIGGAWWKRSFLGQRLASRRLLPPNGLIRGFMNVLLFLHFILFSLITLLALALLGIFDIDHAGNLDPADVWVLVALFIGGFTTYIVRSAGQPHALNANVKTRMNWLEFGADGLLWISVSLVTRTFWDGLAGLIEPARGVGMSAQGLVLLVAVSLLFVVFYLPSRYLFLVEDHRSALTWVQVWVAVLPLVWLVIIG